MPLKVGGVRRAPGDLSLRRPAPLIIPLASHPPSFPLPPHIAFSYQVDNGIPIQSWYDDEQDKHLLDILQFLEKIAGCDDVRPHLDERFRVRERMRKAQSLFPLA